MDFYMMCLMLLMNLNTSSGQFPTFFPVSLQSYYQIGDMGYGMSFRSKYELPYGNSGGMLPNIEDYEEPSYVDSEDCSCSCSQCERPKACCRHMCYMCIQPNVVLLPYPYPLVITTPSTTKLATVTPATTSVTKPVTSTTSPTTTSEPITETEETQSKVRNSFVEDYALKTPQTSGDGKFALASLRRTKDDWRPKYGIVPIPDHLAEILMTQLRDMRSINSR